MNQPIPRNGTELLKVGDQVQIVPEWQDPGDDQFESFVIEAPPDCTRVRIRTILPNLIIYPTSSSTQPSGSKPINSTSSQQLKTN